MISFRSSLWFDGQALPAAEFYQKVFKNVEIEQIEKYGKVGQEFHGQKEGAVMTVAFKIGKQKFLGLNGGPMFKMNPSFSNYILSSSMNEIDELWSKLSEGGQSRMALNEYPWAKKYGWTTDRFGVEWQLMYSEDQNEIFPSMLFVDQLFGQGHSALDFYTKHFKPSEVQYKAVDEKNKTIMHAQFLLCGQKFALMEGEGKHGHVFNEGYSMIIECQTQEEIDYHWYGLIKNGGAESQCGWLKDPYGISWQIVPKEMDKWLSDSTQEQKDRMMNAMFQMKKLDIATLKAALK